MEVTLSSIAEEVGKKWSDVVGCKDLQAALAATPPDYGDIAAKLEGLGEDDRIFELADWVRRLKRRTEGREKLFSELEKEIGGGGRETIMLLEDFRAATDKFDRKWLATACKEWSEEECKQAMEVLGERTAGQGSWYTLTHSEKRKRVGNSD